MTATCPRFAVLLLLGAALPAGSACTKEETSPDTTAEITMAVVACTDGACTLNDEPSMMACTTVADCDAATMCAMDAMDVMGPNLTACPVSEQASDTALIAQLHKLDITCPPPTVKDRGGKCVLTQNVTLTESLDLSSLTHLNCKTFKILPSSGGSFGTNPNGSSTVTNSNPRAAFVLHEAYGTKIQNCNIGEDGNRFDFGIIAVENKIPPDLVDDPGAISLLSNKILNNTITTVRSAVTILGSDNNMIEDNILRIIAAAPAIHILRDSDNNTVLHNTITLDGHGAVQTLNSFSTALGQELDEETVPGHFVGNINGSQVAHIRIAIGRRPLSNGNPTNNELINFRLGGQLLQFPLTRNSVTGNANEQPDNNIIDGNILNRTKMTVGTTPNMFEAGGSSNIFRNNIVNKGWMGIGIAGEVTVGVRNLAKYPGKCTLDMNRYCRFASDCTTLQPDPPGGTCGGVLTGQTIDESAENVIVENNIMTGPYTCPAAPQGLYIAGTKNIRVVGNTVGFNGVPNGPSDPGATILDRSNETAIFSRNVITGNSTGLRLYSQFNIVRSFVARVSLNDFVGNVKNTVDDGRTNRFLPQSRFPFAAELSVDGKGNHWGRTCDDSEGFYDFNELNKCTHNSSVSCTTDSDCSALADGSKCIKTTDSPRSDITDSHPYGQPVAGTPDALLPPPCK